MLSRKRKSAADSEEDNETEDKAEGLKGIVFEIDGLQVCFPYERVYREQLQYMVELKKTLDANGDGLLEMPTGTGKTTCLLSLLIAYKYANPNKMSKLIYCTRTVSEMDQCMAELKKLCAFRKHALSSDKSDDDEEKFIAVCLSSRKNLCIHPRISKVDRDKVDIECRKLTASWVRSSSSSSSGHEKTRKHAKPASSVASIETCGFFEQWDQAGTDAKLKSGVYNCQDLKQFGMDNGWCPYFVARHAITMADVVVYNYQYMLDPKVAGLISQELNENAVVVFDEGHNIDNICIEALSVELDTSKLDRAQRCVTKLSHRVDELRAEDADRIRNEYQKLVSNLRSSGALPRASITDDQLGSSPVIPANMADDALPGSIRRAEHFLRMMRVIIQYLKKRLLGGSFSTNATNITSIQKRVEVESPAAFLLHLEQKTALEREPLKYFYSRLHSLLRTVEMAELEDSQALSILANFITLAATYHEEHNSGFAVIFDPFFRGATGIPEPKLIFSCLDASLAIDPVFKKFSSVIITSGTLSPLDLYPKLLKFQPVVKKSFAMSIFRTCILPLIVTKGTDQQAISTRFEARDDISIIRNYGALLVELVAAIPDGIVAFFTSYQYMETIIAKWDEMGVIRQLLEHKLVFIETKDVTETSYAYENYKRACDIGRGAIFLSIARGKVAEGVDFKGHYGRCVITLGVPYQYTQSHILRTRLEYLLTTHQIREADFLTFDAMRQTSQCIGRVIRSKKDYGIVVLADARYTRPDKREKLPSWVQQFIHNYYLNLTTDEALSLISRFLRQMGQPFSEKDLDTIQLDIKAANEVLLELCKSTSSSTSNNNHLALPAVPSSATPSST